MEEALGPAPERGLIRFCAVPEENFATSGKTVAGQIDDLEKEVAEDNINLRKSLSRGVAPKAKRRQSARSLRSMKIGSQLPTHDEQMPTPPASASFDNPPLPEIPRDMSSMDRKAEKVQKIGRRKSFISSIFGRKD